MRYRRRAIIAVGVLGLIPVILFCMETTTYGPDIRANAQLHQSVTQKLSELRARGTLSSWYCSLADHPPARFLADLYHIAPEHEFVRLYFRRRWWKEFIPESTPSSSRIDVAIRKTDGKAEFVSEPLNTMKSYPDFLVWVKARIQTEEDARIALAVVRNSRGVGGTASAFVACQAKTGIWHVGLQPDGCDDPELILHTDKNGFVIGGIMK